MNREYRGDLAERRRVRAEAREQQVKRGMPVMQVNRVRFLLRGGDPGRSCGTEQCKLRGIGGKRALGLVAEINPPLAVGGKERMIEDQVVDPCCGAGYAPGIDGFDAAAEVCLDRADSARAFHAVQRTIGRRCDGRLPPEPAERNREVAHDIADTADLAAGQGAVFGRQEKYGACIDRRGPSGCDAVFARACRA